MDTLTISAAMASAKVAVSTLQTLAKLKLDHDTLARINDALQAVADVQQKLLSTQQQLFELQQERDDLHRRIESNEQWNSDKAKYVSINAAGGAVVFQSVADPKRPACFAEKKIIPLQGEGTNYFKCPKCSVDYRIGDREQEIQVNSDYDPFGR